MVHSFPQGEFSSLNPMRGKIPLAGVHLRALLASVTVLLHGAKTWQLLGRLHQPLEHRIGVDLEHPRRAPDAQPFGQACDNAHDELDGDTLAMEEGAKGLEKIAVADHRQQLPPGTTVRMAIGAEIPPADPAPIDTVRVRTEVRRGIDLAAASPRGHDPRGRGGGAL